MLNKYPDPLFYTMTTPSGFVPTAQVSLSTQLILQEAQKHGVTYEEIPDTKIFKLKYKNIVRYFHEQRIYQTLEIGFSICLNKVACKEFLSHAGITVPKGYAITKTMSNDNDLLEEIFASCKKPLVVKPSHGEKGQDIYMGITTLEELREITQHLLHTIEEEESVLIEETCSGKEFRILASRDKVLGIVNRVPANVVGDAKHTIRELIEIKNSDPLRVENPSSPRVKIKIDEQALKLLGNQKLTLESILPVGQQAFLRQNSNISTGGDSYDFTDTAHPTVKEIALRVVNAIPGVAIVGIDFMTEDITAPQTGNTYTIIEVNGSPAVYLHHYPFVGTQRNCAEEYVFLLFPEIKEGT